MTFDEEAADLMRAIDATIRSTQIGRIDTDAGPVFVGWPDLLAPPGPVSIGVDLASGPDQTVYRLPRHLLTLDLGPAWWADAEPFTGCPDSLIWPTLPSE